MQETKTQFFQEMFEMMMQRMDGIQQNVLRLENGISSLRGELTQALQNSATALAANLSSAQGEIKQEIQDSETRMATAVYDVKTDLKQEIADSEKYMKFILETDTDKRIQLLFEGQQLLTEKLTHLETELLEMKDNSSILNTLNETAIS